MKYAFLTGARQFAIAEAGASGKKKGGKKKAAKKSRRR